jgi:hypothetical protein
MNLGKEMVDQGRIIIKYIRGEEMEADGFSKPDVSADNGWAF